MGGEERKRGSYKEREIESEKEGERREIGGERETDKVENRDDDKRGIGCII